MSISDHWYGECFYVPITPGLQIFLRYHYVCRNSTFACSRSKLAVYLRMSSARLHPDRGQRSTRPRTRGKASRDRRRTNSCQQWWRCSKIEFQWRMLRILRTQQLLVASRLEVPMKIKPSKHREFQRIKLGKQAADHRSRWLKPQCQSTWL